MTTELEDRLMEQVKEAAPAATIVVATTAEGWDREYPRAHVVFGRGATPERISSARRLRWIQVWSAGVDRYMFRELVDSNIVLTNVRGMHGHTIADHVMMFMLVLSRNFHVFYRQQQQREWRREPSAFELAGTTLGIVGLGGIGTEIARRGRAFGQRVLAVRRHPDTHPAADEVFGVDGLLHVLGQSDYVALACPLTRETRGLIGRAELASMRPGAYLINISRGGIIDEDALVEALQNHQLAGAGLDVFIQEPLPQDSPLWKMDNVLITPHIAGSQRNYMERAVAIFVDNLRRFQDGIPLINEVDKNLGY